MNQERLGLGLCFRSGGLGYGKGCLADDLGNGTTADALHTHGHGGVFPFGGRHVDALQVRLELATRDAGDLRTNTTKVLALTANRDLVPFLRSFAANLTLSGHC